MKKKIQKDKSDFAFAVAQEVLEARLTRGLTQAQLAKKMGTQQPSIARLENGVGFPSLTLLFRMAKALGTSLISPKFEFLEKVREVHLSSQSPTQNKEISVTNVIWPTHFLKQQTKTETGTLQNV